MLDIHCTNDSDDDDSCARRPWCARLRSAAQRAPYTSWACRWPRPVNSLSLSLSLSPYVYIYIYIHIVVCICCCLVISDVS